MFVDVRNHLHMNYCLEEIQIQEKKLKNLIGSKVLHNNKEYIFLSFTRNEITFRETCPNTSTQEISYCIICDLQGKNGETIEVFSDEILVINP